MEQEKNLGSTKGLTIEKLKRMKNYETISDVEAEEIVYAIKNLAIILYEYLNENKTSSNEYKQAV
ncbi:MAG: hypothetical protein LCH32_02625 [Bacteroidetes bacterium]|uniref:hypothetical protein n=1 Tax=Flavobacterium filum TaxID=370974 RepID=UPI0023F0AADA|nr:hypothetical protein [Flavobacterium filum]MCA0429377.1 hypothetical protein [Bacteroidota bacterium]